MSRRALAIAAVLAALGGGSVYAAGKVGSSDIRTNAVKTRHVAPATLGPKHGVIHTKRVKINDPHTSPTDDTATAKTLLRFGPFSIRVQCTDNGGGASTGFAATARSRRKAFATGITPTGPLGKSALPLTGTSNVNVGVVNVRGLDAFTAGGDYVTVQVFEVNKPDGANTGTDCLVWANGTGRK